MNLSLISTFYFLSDCVFLSLDTSFFSLSASLFDSHRVLKSLKISELRASEGIFFLLRELGVEVREIQALISTVGPGSFTGLRSGLAFCNTVALLRNIPYMALSNTIALADFYIRNGNTTCCVALSFKGSGIYWDCFSPKQSQGQLQRFANDSCLLSLIREKKEAGTPLVVILGGDLTLSEDLLQSCSIIRVENEIMSEKLAEYALFHGCFSASSTVELGSFYSPLYNIERFYL